MAKNVHESGSQKIAIWGVFVDVVAIDTLKKNLASITPLLRI